MKRVRAKKIIPILLSVVICVGNIAFADDLSQLMNMSAIPIAGNGMIAKSPREQAVYNVAYTLGAQKSYLKQLHLIQSHIRSKSAQMNRIFNFRSLINLSNTSRTRYVIPPVIQLATRNVNVNDGGDFLTISGAVYRIVAPAHLAIAPPTWQEFLLFGFGNNAVTPIEQTLLPKTDQERTFWRQGILSGWKAGIHQANTEMSNRIRKLHLYYNGMALYEKLLMRRVVTKPFVAVSHTNVDGHDNQMDVNQQTYRITVPAKLNRKFEQWKSIPDMDGI